jgi:hypothetical protein
MECINCGVQIRIKEFKSGLMGYRDSARIIIIIKIIVINVQVNSP